MIFWYQPCDFVMKLYILKCAFVQYQSILPDPHWRQSAQHKLILKMVVVMVDLEKWSWHCTIKHINSWKNVSYLFLVSYGHDFSFCKWYFISHSLIRSWGQFILHLTGRSPPGSDPEPDFQGLFPTIKWHSKPRKNSGFKKPIGAF